MPFSENWDLQVDPYIYRVLKKMPRHETEAILKAIRLLPLNPYLGDIRKMKGYENVWRRRIGNYRIYYKLKPAEKVILVFLVKRRTSKTY